MEREIRRSCFAATSLRGDSGTPRSARVLPKLFVLWRRAIVFCPERVDLGRAARRVSERVRLHHAAASAPEVAGPRLPRRWRPFRVAIPSPASRTLARSWFVANRGASRGTIAGSACNLHVSNPGALPPDHCDVGPVANGVGARVRAHRSGSGDEADRSPLTFDEALGLRKQPPYEPHDAREIPTRRAPGRART
jgi:hypothetical protein